jgi:hypothetical protein
MVDPDGRSRGDRVGQRPGPVPAAEGPFFEGIKHIMRTSPTPSDWLLALAPRIALPLAFMAIGCSGKGGDARTSNPDPRPAPINAAAPVAAALPEGIWTGTFSDAQHRDLPVHALVLANGEAHLVAESFAITAVTLRDGQGVGRLVLLNGRRPDAGGPDRTATVRLLACEPGVSFQGTIEAMNEVGQFRFDRYDRAYEARLTPAILAGTYVLADGAGPGEPITLTLNPDGTVQGRVGSQAQVAGSFVIPDPARSAVRLNLVVNDPGSGELTMVGLASLTTVAGQAGLNLSVAGQDHGFHGRLALTQPGLGPGWDSDPSVRQPNRPGIRPGVR